MKPLFLIALSALAAISSPLESAPINQYPPAALPYGPTDSVIGTQNGQTRQFLLTAAGGGSTATLVADEAITAPSLVSVKANFHIVHANASTGLPANGFITTTVGSGAVAIVYGGGVVGGFSGLTGGSAFLSYTTPGGVTSTPPASGSGDYAQLVGYAISATTIVFNPGALNGPL